MKTLRNFALGAAIAAVLLAPVAWADANRLLSGQAPGAALAHSVPSPVGQTAAALRGAFPHLFACLFAHLPAVRSEGR